MLDSFSILQHGEAGALYLLYKTAEGHGGPEV